MRESPLFPVCSLIDVTTVLLMSVDVQFLTISDRSIDQHLYDMYLYIGVIGRSSSLESGFSSINLYKHFIFTIDLDG